MPVIALLDACVLYSAALRDLFMWLTVSFVFQPKWTERIHAEWMTNVMKNRPDLSRFQLERTRDLMNRRGGDWFVPSYDHLIETLALPDANDRHVLAAAIAAKVSLIVTYNLSDFPENALAPFGITAVSPDVFLTDLLRAKPTAFLEAAKDHRTHLKNPPKTARDYLDTLKACQLPRLASHLESFQDEI